MTARTLLRSAIVLLSFAIFAGGVDVFICGVLFQSLFWVNGALLALACEAAMVVTADVHHIRPAPKTCFAVIVGIGSAFPLLVVGLATFQLEMERFRWFASSKTLYYLSIGLTSALAGASVAAASRRLVGKADRTIEVLMVVWAGVWFFLPWLGGWVEYRQLGTSATPGWVMLLLWHLPISLLWAVRIVR
jgi:hypothetical protein